jgi:hypothetical protein
MGEESPEARIRRTKGVKGRSIPVELWYFFYLPQPHPARLEPVSPLLLILHRRGGLQRGECLNWDRSSLASSLDILSMVCFGRAIAATLGNGSWR